MAAAAAAAALQEMRQHLENLRFALRDRNIIQLARFYLGDDGSLFFETLLY